MRDIFISYARKDIKCAEFLERVLGEQAWSIWRDKLRQAVEEAGCVITLWSNSSVRSNWVKYESRKARNASKLIPITVDGTKPPKEFRRLHYGDITGWEQIVDIDTERESDEDLEKIVDAVRKTLDEDSLRELLYRYLVHHEGWWCWPYRIKEDSALYLRFEPISTARLSTIHKALDELCSSSWVLCDGERYGFFS